MWYWITNIAGFQSNTGHYNSLTLV